MEFDGDVLKIDLNMSLEEVRDFFEFIRDRLDYIESISINEGTEMRSSALLALLVSIKKTRPEIDIPFLDKKEIYSNDYGTMHWIAHD